MTTRRITAGLYEVSDARTVTVERMEHLDGLWVAASGWDRFAYSDPLPTKARAVRVAREMLAEESS